MTYWLNGEFHNRPAAIDIADRGFLLGDGVFETLFARDGAPAFLREHLARLREGLAALRIEAPLPENIGKIIRRLTEANSIEGRSAAARITVSRGPSGRGLSFPAAGKERATVLITTAQAPPPAAAPAKLFLSSFTRPEASIAARCKTLNYLDNVLARNEAIAAGADEAVMLNGKGRIACASTANIFIIDERGAVATPPVGDGALPGVVRGLLLGADAGVDIGEAPLEPSALRTGAVFITNSLTGLRAATPFENETPWPQAAVRTLQRLQSWYEKRLRDDLAERF